MSIRAQLASVNWHGEFLEAVHRYDLTRAARIITPYAEAHAIARALPGNNLKDGVGSLRSNLRALAGLIARSESRYKAVRFGEPSSVPQALSLALNSLVPISLLPVELILEIFEMTALFGVMDVFNVSHVCSSWRQLTCGMPSLWTVIVSDRTSAALLRLFFERASGLPISLAITSRRSTVDVLFTHHPEMAHQVKKIALYRYPTDWESTTPGLGPLSVVPVFSNVEEISVIHAGGRYEFLFGMLEGERFPSLRHLDMDRHLPIASNSMLISTGVHIGQTLETLRMHGVVMEYDSLRVCLAKLPKLKSLVLSEIRRNSSEDFSEVVTHSCVLEDLTSLEVRRCSPSFTVLLLDLVKAPSLRKLEISPEILMSRIALHPHFPNTLQSLTDSLSNFLLYGQKLEELCIAGDAWALARIAQSLVQPPGTTFMPSLSHLSINFIPIEYHDRSTCEGELRDASHYLWDFLKGRQIGTGLIPAPRQPQTKRSSSLRQRTRDVDFVQTLSKVELCRELISFSDDAGIIQLLGSDEDGFKCPVKWV